MLIESYLTALFLCISYGKPTCWAIISFITSLIAFAFVVVTTLVLRKNEKQVNWFVKLVLTLTYFILAWVLICLYYGVSPAKGLSIPLKYGLGVFFIFVLPFSWVYKKLMKKYPMLPWHFMQYLCCLVASLIFWAIVIFYFNLFFLA